MGETLGNRSNTLLQDISVVGSKATFKEQAKTCWKLSYTPRNVKNKGAILVLVWNYLVMSVFYLLMNYTDSVYDKIWQFVVGIILPLSGWLADAYIGRYKLIHWSLWIMWLATVLATVSSVTDQLSDAYDNIHIKVWAFLRVALAMGFGGFQANIIQFGIDQLQDASTTEIKSFIIWYVWTIFGPGVILDITFSCVSQQYEIFRVLYVSMNITLALLLLYSCNTSHWLIKEPVVKNPFRLVYQVIRYTIKNKHPRQRSAFTYCEDYIPSRIDFSKIKYGGPFTTEQVEDIKTVLRLLPIIIVGSIVGGVFFAIKQIRHYFTRQLTRYAGSDKNNAEYSLSECYVEASFFHLFGYSAIFLVILHEVVIYPIFHRLYLKIKSVHKVYIGMVLQIATVIVLTVYEIYSHHQLAEMNDYNTTIPCVFNAYQGVLSTSFDYRLMTIPDTLVSYSILMVAIGSLEFLSAQVPFSMKGIILGVSYGSTFIFSVILALIMWPFKTRVSSWGSGVISCGFWFNMLILLIQLLVSLILVPLIRWYKQRKREDLLPNEHYYAECYYSKESESNEVN